MKRLQLCERMKELRQGKHLTQEQLAHELHISRSAYALYETGKRELGYDSLCAIADFFGVSLDYLFGRTDVPDQLEDFSPEQRDMMRKFSELDKRGKENIRMMLQLEYNRQIKGS